MKVLVNLTWLVPGTVGGSEESTTDAIRAMLEHEPEVELTLAVLSQFAKAHPDLAEACPCEVLDSSGGNKVARVAAEQTWLARRTSQLAPDVVHHAGGVMPLRHPGRTVLTIHDLQPLDMPQNFSAAKRADIRTMVGRSARAADVVAVPSHFTASRVVNRLGIKREKVEVVPWSVVSLDSTESAAPAGNTADPAGAPGPGDEGDTVFLYPAITYPHKNHLTLLDAFADFTRTHRAARLVLAGGPGQCEDEVAERIARGDLLGSVDRPGRVSRQEMERLYRCATAVLVPSRYEGFGLPALEAMSRGVPLVVSDAGSLPEVVRGVGATPTGTGTRRGAPGTGARRGAPGRAWVVPVPPVDPDDVAAWTAAMDTVAALDAEKRREIGDAEIEIARSFTPQRTAEALTKAYGRAASAGAAGSDRGRSGS